MRTRGICFIFTCLMVNVIKGVITLLTLFSVMCFWLNVFKVIMFKTLKQLSLNDCELKK